MKKDVKQKHNHYYSKVKNIDNIEQAKMVLKYLRDASFSNIFGNYFYVSAPMYCLDYAAAYIYDETKSFYIINPIILSCSNKRMFYRERNLVEFGQYNCIRYNNIIIKNGLEQKEVEFEGEQSAIIQNVIDQFNGVSAIERTFKMGVVRENGLIKDTDYCPCLSRLKYSECCKTKDLPILRGEACGR